jgi:regulator of protease activity HflC (stomatin/prohibitin superfamily)
MKMPIHKYLTRIIQYNEINLFLRNSGENHMNIALALQGIVAVLWIITLGFLIIAVLRASRGFKTRALGTTVIVLAVVSGILTSISAGLVFIDPQDRGVVISALSPKGYREQALQPGLHWVVPFFEYVKTYTISKQTYTMSVASTEGAVAGDDSVQARTSDGQQISLDASVIYEIDPTQVVTVHITWQDRYTDELVRPQSRGIIRDAVSQFNVEEVVTSKRFELASEIRQAMEEKLKENGLVLVDFVLRNISFSSEYAASVEQKQIAEQQAQQAKFVVEQRKQEAQQAIEVAHGQAESVKIRAQGDADARLIQAQAEAQALKMIADALKDNPDLLNYQYITKLAPDVQVMLVPNNAPYLLPLPTMNSTTTVDIPTPTAEPTLAPTPIPTTAP